jgi:tetratricopeptide (TPR) repeat protein
MRFLARCLVLASLLPSAAHAQARGRARIERDLAGAERFLVRGNRPRALAALVRVAERNPGDARAALRYCDLTVPETAATVDALLADEASVQLEATQCAALLSTRPDTGTRLRWVNALLGQPTGYIESIREGGLDENDLAPLRQAAALAMHAGDARLAERALGYALHVRPQDPSIQHDLALLLLARGDAAAALPFLRRVVAVHPSEARVLRDYAGALLQAGQTQAAIATYQALVTQAPNESESWLSLARARVEAGEYTAGASDAARALELATASDGRAALLRGDALRLARDEAGARAAYEEALRREPRNARATQALEALTRE